MRAHKACFNKVLKEKNWQLSELLPYCVEFIPHENQTGKKSSDPEFSPNCDVSQLECKLFHLTVLSLFILLDCTHFTSREAWDSYYTTTKKLDFCGRASVKNV